MYCLIFDRLLLMAEGKVAYLGAAKDAIPFFNQYVVDMRICYWSCKGKGKRRFV